MKYDSVINGDLERMREEAAVAYNDIFIWTGYCTILPKYLTEAA